MARVSGGPDSATVRSACGPTYPILDQRGLARPDRAGRRRREHLERGTRGVLRAQHVRRREHGIELRNRHTRGRARGRVAGVTMPITQPVEHNVRYWSPATAPLQIADGALYAVGAPHVLVVLAVAIAVALVWLFARVVGAVRSAPRTATTAVTDRPP